MKQVDVLRLLMAAGTLFLSACSGPGGLQVKDAWARPSVAGQNSAVYFTIDNYQTEKDTLLRAASDVAGKVELHRSMITGPEAGDEMQGADHEAGRDVMRMVPQESVEIPANSEVNFTPGGLHVMLVELRQDLKEGETFALTLQFEEAGEIEVQVPVRMR